MHGYFTNYEKAVQYAVAKAYETIPETPNFIFKINGHDGCFVDTENYASIQNVKCLSKIKNAFNCVAFPRQMKDTQYDAFIRDILTPSNKTAETTSIQDFLGIMAEFGCNSNAFSKEFYESKFLQDTVTNQRDTLNALLVKEVIIGNLVDYLSQDDIVAFVSSEVFAIVKVFEP